MNGRSNVTLLGNLTNTIETRTTNSGKNVASFTVAVNHTKDEVSYIDCVAWEATADFLSKYSKKGQTLYIEGTLKQNKWQDKNGNNRSRIEVIVRGAEILSGDRQEKTQDVVVDDVDDEPISLDGIPF